MSLPSRPADPTPGHPGHPRPGSPGAEARCRTCSAWLIGPCAAADPAVLAAMARIRPVRAGETVFAQGDAARWLFQVRAGTVRTCIDAADGRRQLVEFIHPGEAFGFPGAGTYSFTAEAIDDGELCLFDRPRLETMGREAPAFALRLAELEAQERDRLRQRLFLLGRSTATERVAAFLLRLVERTGARSVLLPTSRREIAEYLALTPETVSRILTRLAREGVLSPHGARGFEVHDPARLEALART